MGRQKNKFDKTMKLSWIYLALAATAMAEEDERGQKGSNACQGIQLPSESFKCKNKKKKEDRRKKCKVLCKSSMKKVYCKKWLGQQKRRISQHQENMLERRPLLSKLHYKTIFRVS